MIRTGLRLLVLVMCVAMLARFTVRAQDAELPGEFVSARGFVVRHPANWVLLEDDVVITIGTNREAVQAGTPLRPGETRSNLIVVAPGEINFVQAGDTAVDILNGMRDLPIPETCSTFSPVDFILTTNRIVYYAEQTCQTYDNISMVVAVDDGHFAMLAGTVLHGELDDFRPIFVQMLLSISFDVEPPTMQLFNGESVVTFDDTRVHFTHPQNWHIVTITIQRTVIQVLTMDSEFAFAAPEAGRPFALLELGRFSEVIDAPLDFIPPEARPQIVLEQLNASTENDFGAVVRFNYDGRYGARTDAIYDNFDNITVAFALNDDDYFYANLFAAPGEMDEFYDMVLAVLFSADLTNPALPEPGGGVAMAAH